MTTPRRNREFWLAKFAANVERDARARDELVRAGFDVRVLWECTTENDRELEQCLRAFFDQARGKRES